MSDSMTDKSLLRVYTVTESRIYEKRNERPNAVNPNNYYALDWHKSEVADGTTK